MGVTDGTGTPEIVILISSLYPRKWSKDEWNFVYTCRSLPISQQIPVPVKTGRQVIVENE
jgi:hypothetical protein